MCTRAFADALDAEDDFVAGMRDPRQRDYARLRKARARVAAKSGIFPEVGAH
jgi:hypothetical protein